jgi:cytochrome c553
MLGSVPSLQKNLGAPLQSRKAMLETLCRHLDMVRLSAAGLMMFTLVGCTGLIDGGSDGLSKQQRIARQQWEESAMPVLATNCQTCHNGSRANVGFLVGNDDMAVRDTLLNYQPSVVNFDAASSSRILTKGLHEGPQLTAEQSSALLLWVQAERDAVNHDPDHPQPVLATPAAALQMCTGGDPDNAAGTCPTNHIALSMVPTAGAAVPGAEITFTAQGLGTGLYLTNLAVVGGTAGVYMEHLLFVSTPMGKDPFPDQIDRYFATKLNVKAGSTSPLDGGTEDFLGFVPTDMLEIHFKVIQAYKPDTTGTTTTGCKVLASFKTNAQSQLNTNCASCHAGANASATSAMDISKIAATTDADLLNACGQVRSRINFQTTDQSGFYLAPDPGSATNHPFKFNGNAAAFTAFKTAMDVWVKAEQTAP